jgi:hypothetical protein
MSIHLGDRSDPFRVYEEVAEAGISEIRRRQRWWEHHRLILQSAVLALDLLVVLGLLTAGLTEQFGLIVPGVVLLGLGLLVLALVSSVPRLYEYVRTDYHATVRVGCRTLGGIGVMPAAILDVGGPLRKQAEKFLEDAGLGARERETVETLREGWAGSLGQLVVAARSLSRT